MMARHENAECLDITPPNATHDGRVALARVLFRRWHARVSGRHTVGKATGRLLRHMAPGTRSVGSPGCDATGRMWLEGVKASDSSDPPSHPIHTGAVL